MFAYFLQPARPPPPKFEQGGFSPRKICEDENSNMVGDENNSVVDGANRPQSDDVKLDASQNIRNSRNEIKGRSTV